MTRRIASVLLPMPLPEAFDYEEPEGMDLAVGDQVAAPLGPRLLRGVVTGLRDGTGGNRPLKVIDSKLDDPPLPQRAIDFIQWAARYSVDSPGSPLAITLRGARAQKAKPEKVVEATGVMPARPTAARTKVLETVATQRLSPPDLARAAGVSSGVIKGLVDEGVLAVRLIEAPVAFDPPDLSRVGHPLNPSQDAAAKA
ncbi:MAG: primosomal protein N', partial [Phenylobacterium sp.]|nr:primosomal protein N' [Phenylobacterium sp.]